MPIWSATACRRFPKRPPKSTRLPSVLKSGSKPPRSKTRTLIAFLGALFLAAWAGAAEPAARSPDPWSETRKRLVEYEIVAAGIKDPRVCDAMRTTPRHEFIPAALRRYAYFDIGMPIGEGQTITSPFVVAYMTEQLQPQATDKVLEIGTGSGYQAAVLSGLVASVMVALGLSAATGWLVFGVLAIALSRLVWPVLRPRALPAAMSGAALPQTGADLASASEIILLALAYGLAGFGYIITATFLPVIARGALPGSHWLDLFWPLFGSGVVIGAWLATRLRHIPAQRGRLAAAYAMQAAGVALSLLWPTLAGFALGSLLLGLPFTAITFFAMQEVRRLRPHSVASTTGLLTARYGLGQIAGPPMTAALLQRGGERAGFALALEIASASLVLGALLYLLLARLYPHRGATR